MTLLVQFIDGSDVPVIMQRRLYSGNASDSVSPVTVDIPVVQQRRVLDLAVMAVIEGFVWALEGPFRRY